MYNVMFLLLLQLKQFVIHGESDLAYRVYYCENLPGGAYPQIFLVNLSLPTSMFLSPPLL